MTLSNGYFDKIPLNSFEIIKVSTLFILTHLKRQQLRKTGILFFYQLQMNVNTSLAITISI